MDATPALRDPTGGDRPMTDDASVDVTDLHAFERDVLFAVRALERSDGSPHGQAVKSRLEDEYGEEINHGRLYQNLDHLVEAGLLEKGKKDSRTNEYMTTKTARDLLEARTKQRIEQVGLETTGSVNRRNKTCSERTTSPVPDTENVTVLLDGEEMDIDELTEDSGTWTHETDIGRVQVTLKWNADFFTHSSALVGPDEVLVPLDLESPSSCKTDPVFVPTDKPYNFKIELVRDDASSKGDME